MKLPDPTRPSSAALHYPRRDLYVDGLRLAVYEAGTGEPILLLHGYPQSHWCWRHIIPALAPTHRVIAVDWFGWGDSERASAAAGDHQTDVERIGRLLDALQVNRVNLFAHDYGGYIGLGFAVRHPARLMRLAILNSRAHRTFPMPSYALFGALSAIERSPFRERVFRALPLYSMHRRSLQSYIANGSWSVDDCERYLVWLRNAEGRDWLGQFYRNYRVGVRRELAAGCAGIRIPASIVWGDADPFCPFSIAQDLSAHIPNAKLVCIEGGDHYIMEQKPDDVITALQALLEVSG